jgi:hypothetical protein
MQFDLVCGLEHLTELISTIYMLGTLIGAFATGLISDK